MSSRRAYAVTAIAGVLPSRDTGRTRTSDMIDAVRTFAARASSMAQHRPLALHAIPSVDQLRYLYAHI